MAIRPSLRLIGDLLHYYTFACDSVSGAKFTPDFQSIVLRGILHLLLCTAFSPCIRGWAASDYGNLPVCGQREPWYSFATSYDFEYSTWTTTSFRILILVSRSMSLTLQVPQGHISSRLSILSPRSWILRVVQSCVLISLGEKKVCRGPDAIVITNPTNMACPFASRDSSIGPRVSKIMP